MTVVDMEDNLGDLIHARVKDFVHYVKQNIVSFIIIFFSCHQLIRLVTNNIYL